MGGGGGERKGHLICRRTKVELIENPKGQLFCGGHPLVALLPS